MADKFSSQVADWAKKTEVQQTAVLHQALRGLDREIAENTPKVSGNTVNSRTVSSLARPTVDFRTKKFRNPDDSINGAIAGVEIGQTVWLGYRAPWAHKLEPKHAMLRRAAQRWRQIADEAARIVKGRG